MQDPNVVVVGAQLGQVARRPLLRQQVAAHAHRAAGIGHVDHRADIVGRNFHRGVHPAAGRPTNQQRRLALTEVGVALHLGGHMLHFLKAGGDQARQANDVSAFLFGFGQDVLAGHHHPHVHDFEVIALQDHGDDVLADVVHIALDGGDHDLALGPGLPASLDQGLLFSLDVGQ